MPEEVMYDEDGVVIAPAKKPNPPQWGSWAPPQGTPIPAEYWIPPNASFGEDPSGITNRQNPWADPGKPFVQEGTTGGYQVGVGITRRSGTSQTQAEYEAAKTAATARAAELGISLEEWEKKNPEDYHRFLEAHASEGMTGGGGNGGGTDNITNQWLDYIKQRDGQADQERAQNREKMDYLWQTYKTRSQQALTGDDPTVKPQVDAYRANETRAKRDYLADVAEQSGPYANLRGEERLASERVGQRTGTFEAEIRSRTLIAQRNEIAQALSSMGGMLDADMQRDLIERMHLLDNAIAQQQIALGKQGLDQDWQKALMQNGQFMQQLGLTAEDRASYWDAVRRGDFN